MASLINRSAEACLLSGFALVGAILLALIGYVCWLQEWPFGVSLLMLLTVASLLSWLAFHTKSRVFSAFDRALLHLEAIHQEDYHQYARKSFPAGQAARLHQQLVQLSQDLLAQKSRYGQQVLLVYQLIEHLDTPILVFNARLQLVFANEAFYQLYQQPWPSYRLAPAAMLGLELSDQQWRFGEPAQNKNWLIRNSEFFEGGEQHQLLVFVNIAKALRENQLHAWQQLIRVLGHEIRNTLGSVSSLSETLAERHTSHKDQHLLKVIAEQCDHLQNFVGRYASLSRPLQINARWVQLTDMLNSLQALHPDWPIRLDLQVPTLWADPAYLHQVLLNLLKNAVEAGATDILVQTTDLPAKVQLRLRDNGQGFANPDNAFVPLYTTKENGQGIGLVFCQQVINQHGGNIHLQNNSTSGVTLDIHLPQPEESTAGSISN